MQIFQVKERANRNAKFMGSKTTTLLTGQTLAAIELEIRCEKTIVDRKIRCEKTIADSKKRKVRL